jgi:DHA1 family bicyclomycin/chloramphenicol resistance-like MFS transporter
MTAPANAPAAPAAVSVPFLMTMMLASIFAASIYVPSLPRIAREFAASPAGAQASLTAFVVTFGLTQLWHGPASDRLGRWRVLRLSLVVFLVGTAACAAAPTLEILIAGRVLQGLGAAGIAVLPRAIAQDAYGSTPRGTQVFVYLSMAAALGAAIAPLLGGWLDTLTDSWQASFVLLGFMGVGVLAMAARGAAQLAGASRDRPAGLRGVVRDCRTLMGHRSFAFSVIGGGAMRAGYFGFLTASPFLLTKAYGVAPTLIGALLAALTLSFLAANILVARLAKRFTPEWLSVWGAVFSLLAPIAMAAAALAHAGVIFGIAVPLALFGFGQGIAVPMSNILAVRTDPRMAGTAASLLGFWTHMLGAVGTLAASVLSYGDALPLAGLIGIAVIAALACFLRLVPKARAA